MKKVVSYPSEALFHGDMNLTPTDREFLRTRCEFFNGLADNVVEILRTLDFLNLRIKKLEDKIDWKGEQL